jgi:hypothetical protein
MMCFVKSVQIQNLFSRKDPGAKAEARAALSEVSLDDPLSLEKSFETRHYPLPDGILPTADRNQPRSGAGRATICGLKEKT